MKSPSYVKFNYILKEKFFVNNFLSVKYLKNQHKKIFVKEEKLIYEVINSLWSECKIAA